MNFKYIFCRRYYDNVDDKMSRRYPEFTSELSYTPLFSDNCQSSYSLNQEDLGLSSGYRSTYGKYIIIGQYIRK